MKESLPEESKHTTLWQNRKCYINNLLVATGPIQFGFDIGIIAGFQAEPAFLKLFGYTDANGNLAIETTFQQLLASLPYVGQIVGTLILGYASTYVGRKNSLRAACVISSAAMLLQILAKNQGTVLAGRFFLGFSNILFYLLAILWSAETAPAHLRGTMGQLFQTMTGLGVILGSVVGKAYLNETTRLSYQTQLSFCFIIPAFLFVYTFFMPESPRWLVLKGRTEEALESLRWLRGTGPAAAYYKQELAIIVETVEHERSLTSGSAWTDMFKGTDLRRTLVSVGMATLFVASGAPFISGYCTYFFVVTGQKDPFLDTILALGLAVFLGGVIGLWLTTFVNRKPLLLWTYSIAAAMMLLMAIPYSISPSAPSTGYLIVVAVGIFNAVYGCAIAPVAWVVASEIPSNRLRSKTFSLAMATCNFSNWLLVFTAPYFINPSDLNLGAKYGYIFAGTMLVALAFIYYCVPECRGRTLEEIDELFENKVSARKFTSYVCVGLESTAQVEDVPEEKESDVQTN